MWSEGDLGGVSFVFLDTGDGWSTGAAPLAGASSTSSEMNDCLPSKEWSGWSACAVAATAAGASTGLNGAVVTLGKGCAGAMKSCGDGTEGLEA